MHDIDSLYLRLQKKVSSVVYGEDERPTSESCKM